MTTIQSVMDDLRSKGSDQTRKTYIRHGHPPDRTIGVSVADLKTIVKTIKGQQTLACELYETGQMDAMYLAGLVVNGAKMSRQELQSWVNDSAGMPLISDYTVPWAAVENPNARELAIEWIGSKDEHVAAVGWCTYSGTPTHVKADSELDLAEIEGLLKTVVKEISGVNDRLRLKMNSFVIAVGTYVKPLLEEAKSAARKIGAISADMGDTACKIPLATDYIAKAEAAGKVGLKRKTNRC